MLYAIKKNLFLCCALIHNVTIRVKGFRGKTPTLHGPERLGQPPLRNAKRTRLAAFDNISNVFSLTYSQMTVQQFRQLNVYCLHLYFMKTSHEINCCVFKSRECTITLFWKIFLTIYTRICHLGLKQPLFKTDTA